MVAGSEINYAGRFPGPGLTIFRTLDGDGNWQTGGTPTVGNCNGPCNPGTDLTAIFDTVAPERCRASDGFLSSAVTGGIGPYEYIWNNDDRDPEIGELAAGLYSLTVLDSEGCTFLLDTLLPNIGEPVVVSIEPGEITIFNGDEIQLEVVSPNPLVSAFWDPITGLSCGTCFNPKADPRATTTYTLEVEDLDGCRGDTTIVITVIKDENSAFVPTAFSPDGDGKNDILFIRSPRVANLEFRIFDRWGQEMFFTTDQGIGWDGTDRNGQPANVGVYVYFANIIFENGNERTIKGNVTLLR
jgi:gliding motility-associated-like protein